MKENSPKLGHLITDEVKRDAIHFAVAPVTVHGMHPLKPGDFVKFAIFGNTEMVRACTPEDAIGIVDPFLCVKVKPGQHCWMMLMPNTITGLRHEWTHPAFENETRGISEFWLREFCDKYGLEYDHVVRSFLKSDTCGTGDNEIYLEADERDLLQQHVSTLVGREVEHPHFSCAC